MARILALLGALALVSSFGTFVHPPSPTSVGPPGTSSVTMTLWEAYSRGYISIHQVDLSYHSGGQTVTAPLGYEVRNSRSVSVVIDEHAVLLSPNPRENRDPADTSQDAGLLAPSPRIPGAAPHGRPARHQPRHQEHAGQRPRPRRAERPGVGRRSRGVHDRLLDRPSRGVRDHDARGRLHAHLLGRQPARGGHHGPEPERRPHALCIPGLRVQDDTAPHPPGPRVPPPLP